MAIPVLIIGRSGSGKTYSLKNLREGEIGVISVEKGRLPFRSDIKVAKVPKDPTGGEARDAAQLNAAKYSWIMRAVKNAKTKAIVIDDSQYLFQISQQFIAILCVKAPLLSYIVRIRVVEQFSQIIVFLIRSCSE